MIFKKVFVPILLIAALSISACVYIVLPEGLEESMQDGNSGNSGWAGIVTQITESESEGLHIDLTIRNDTGDWSTMKAQENKPARLTTEDGSTTDCNTVFVSTGGHRLAPGFQIQGYTREENGQPVTQPLYVACESASISPGAVLAIDYISFIGEVDYYVEIEESNKIPGQMALNLDEVVTDLTYPIATSIEGLIQSPDVEFIALSDNVVKLLNIERSEAGFQFTWQNYNPYQFALKTHIGIPPVVGEDGILYGLYETLDLPEVPLTPAEGSVEWTTEVPVPEDVSGLYILLSVESKKPRTYSNYVIDITAQ